MNKSTRESKLVYNVPAKIPDAFNRIHNLHHFTNGIKLEEPKGKVVHLPAHIRLRKMLLIATWLKAVKKYHLASRQ